MQDAFTRAYPRWRQISRYDPRGAVVIGLAVFGSGDGGSVRTPPATNSSNVPTTITPPKPGTPPTESTSEQNDTSGATGESDSDAGTPPVTTPDSTPVQTTTLASDDTPYSSPGGSIVVHRSGSTISLEHAGGGLHRGDPRQRPDTSRGPVKNDQTEWRIRVDLVTGALQAETTHH